MYNQLKINGGLREYEFEQIEDNERADGPSREVIVGIAQSLVGSLAVKYSSGSPELGRSPETGFDCSGFVGYVLNAAGLAIPDYINAYGQIKPIRHANEFWDHYGISVHHGCHLPGDLIFYTRNGFFPGHVGIVRDEESYIHSPGKNNERVEVEPIVLQRAPRFLDDAAPRIVFTQNPIGYKSPTVALPKGNHRFVQKSL